MADAYNFNIDGTIVNVEDATARNPAFTEASTRANITSGESLSTLFGKIKKFFTDLKTVAFTGSYTDLTNKPTIPTVNNATLTIQKNGTNVQTFTANQSTNVTANITMSKSDVGLGNVGNFKAVSTVASQGLTDTEKSNARANIGAGTSSFSGSYTDLTNKPTIPTVNNATLTIQKNGTNVQTFTANASANKTANITVPTKTSELTNDSGFITDAGVTGVKGNSETTYRTGNVNITKANIGLGSVGNFKAVSTAASQELTDTEKSNARANIGAGTSSFSGSYTDLTNKPTIPTVNNATLTIQKNGTNVQTFTANASANKTANITVPTKVSELTNDSGYITSAGTATNVSGTVAIAHGGTGATTYDKARSNLGVGTNKITSATALTVGTHTLSSDGYIICEAGEFTQFYGQIFGSNQQSGTGININARSRLFVRKGMKVVVSAANVIYWLPLS